MELQLFGINHKTAKLSERELFIINDSNQDDFINFLKREFGDNIESFYALSTCNRTEVYFYGDPGTAIFIAHKTLEFFGWNDSVRHGLYLLDGSKLFWGVSDSTSSTYPSRIRTGDNDTFTKQ